MSRPPGLGILLFTMDPDSPLRAWRWNGSAFENCESLPISDRGFRYGMALFESLRVADGTPLFFEQHLVRLRHAARQREFELAESAWAALPPFFNSPERNGFARIYLTAGDGGPTAPAAHGRLFVILEDRSRPEEGPIRAALSPEMHWPLFGGLKTANYWPNLDALLRAQRRGFAESLLFNEHAELVSSAVGNVFAVKDGLVRTPALACGARDGVVREWVLHQVPVRQCSLFLQDVENADEIFVTNSWRGITAVSDVENRRLPSTEISARLSQIYRETILPRE